ncbi:alpha/beta fold hydrolase [Rathayibacter tanaceti]|uniref:Alpha/beta fold hydrolase n=2 Tax=Rathayibacter tanaceti TaxID=1671680 RepID=A0A166H3B6_9MICO|nr:alpha/beta hydrolase [Rathayibacter tanaceti]KZX19861.1 N-formylmaleamate deformylase [Rathayibacter tanaceti]QHC54957.1 alpha/beta fold hydrolase [Rathayibacter tanaceti]TCO38500.1 alpha-beta hydrolase superfamily lysophospholipase [Rathayibacter tanaceti]
MTTRTALLLHGLGGAAGTWWRVSEALTAAGWTVCAPDLRGHGEGPRGGSSRHDDYADDVLASGGGPWDLVVGHSLGGAVAVRAAARAGGWARRLALLDPVLRLSREQAAEVRASELADLTISPDERAAAHPLWHERDLAEKAAAAHAADPASIAAAIDDNDPWDLLDDVPALRIPVLVLAGDPQVFTFFPPALAAEVLRAGPRVRYTVVAGAGHSPHRDAPVETLAMLREWAESPATA